MKVGIFLATTSENKEKKKYLDAFAEGIQNSGSRDQCFSTKSPGYKDCHVAVIFGFYGLNLGNVHKVRKSIYTEHTIKRKRNCIFIDADLFKNIGHNETKDTTHVRISYGSIFFDEAFHFNENSDQKRWNLIKKRKQIDLLDYRTDGEHVLICLNSNPHLGRGWSAGKTNIYNWAESTITEVRKHTDRKIIVRFHPNAKDEQQQKVPIEKFIQAAGENIFFSGGIDVKSSLVMPNTTLVNDCVNAWACIAHNTSAVITPVVCGIPVFTSMPNCPIYPIANHKIKYINNPVLIDREQWLNDAAYCLWNYNEIKDGTVWKRFRPRLNERGEYSKRAASNLK